MEKLGIEISCLGSRDVSKMLSARRDGRRRRYFTFFWCYRMTSNCFFFSIYLLAGTATSPRRTAHIKPTSHTNVVFQAPYPLLRRTFNSSKPFQALHQLPARKEPHCHMRNGRLSRRRGSGRKLRRRWTALRLEVAKGG
jgi:hypothetical protein